MTDPYEIADALYRRGYEDRQKERDYDPRGAAEWQAVVDAGAPPTLESMAREAAIEQDPGLRDGVTVDGLRQGNWQHPDGGRIVGWHIPPSAVERMRADAYCLPREIEACLARLAAAHGVKENQRG